MARSRRLVNVGFSLIELVIVVVIVVVIIGIIGAIAVPRFQDGVRKAWESNLLAILKTMHEMLEVTYHEQQLSSYPATIDPSWFTNDRVPTHPGNSMGEPNVQVVSIAGVSHPTSKVLKTGVGGAFWYNTAEGVVRARMPDLGSAAETLAAYNRVNQSSETALGNYGGGGGGS